MAARVDLKADRKARVLRVPGAHREPGAPPDLPEHLSAALAEVAEWLDLERIEIGEHGDLAAALHVETTRRLG
jgi:hypothetical protein